MVCRRSPKIYHFLTLFCPKHNFTMQWDEIFSEVAIFFKFSRVIYKGVTLKKYIIKEKNWKIHEKRGKNRTSYFCFPTYPLCPIFSRLCLTPPSPLKSDIIYVRSLTFRCTVKERRQISFFLFTLGNKKKHSFHSACFQ